MAFTNHHIDVLLIADPSDPHCQAVETALQSLGAKTLRLNLSNLISTTLVSRNGALDIAEGDGWLRADYKTTVWWFRAGHAFAPDQTAADESHLIADESPAVLIGSLRAAGVRWVDDPDVIRRAEWKLGQLQVAATLQISTPRWIVTNSVPAAGDFSSGHSVIAKTLSSGHGIAPYVAEVLPEEISKLGVLATLLQEKVNATADIRVVVVAGQTWVWRRPREPDTVDWRAVDPRGQGFSQALDAEIGPAPVQITSALGLTVSVQDWLETGSGLVFLEANPQGAWLFLDGAEAIIAPPLALHLSTEFRETEGVWPEPRRRAFYDFLTKSRAPADDGLIAPQVVPPVWVDSVADVPGILEVAKAARENAEDSAKVAEDKASRLVQVTLALLTVSLALGSYQLSFSLQRSLYWMLLLVPIAIALACLGVTAFESMVVDRVGFYSSPSAQDLVDIGQRNPNSILLAHEERGRRLAQWSANHKHTDLMQARAWFTRGLTALLLAGLIAGICRAATTASSHTAPVTVRSHSQSTTPTTRPTRKGSPSPTSSTAPAIQGSNVPSRP